METPTDPATGTGTIIKSDRTGRTRYTAQYKREVLDAFDADALLLTEVYAAGEEPIANADSRSLARCIRSRGKVEPVFVKTVAELPEALSSMLQDGDLLLGLGAGDIGGLPATLLKAFGAAS